MMTSSSQPRRVGEDLVALSSTSPTENAAGPIASRVLHLRQRTRDVHGVAPLMAAAGGRPADGWVKPWPPRAQCPAAISQYAVYVLTGIYPEGHTFLVPVNATIEVIAEPTRRTSSTSCEPVNSRYTPRRATGISQPSASKHLRVLRDAGLVRVRPDGQRRLYSVCCEPLVELDTWLEPYRQCGARASNKLEQHLSETTRRGKKES